MEDVLGRRDVRARAKPAFVIQSRHLLLSGDVPDVQDVIKLNGTPNLRRRYAFEPMVEFVSNVGRQFWLRRGARQRCCQVLWQKNLTT